MNYSIYYEIAKKLGNYEALDELINIDVAIEKTNLTKNQFEIIGLIKQGYNMLGIAKIKGVCKQSINGRSRPFSDGRKEDSKYPMPRRRRPVSGCPP